MFVQGVFQGYVYLTFLRAPSLQTLGLLNFTVLMGVPASLVQDGAILQGVVGHVEGDLDALLMDNLLTGDTWQDARGD